MAAQDRINPIMTLTSPEGSIFVPKWRGSKRQITKKIGQFNYPKFKGTVTQDLDVVSTLYPMVIYFDGRDHDKDANDFLNAFKENGQWEMEHPLTVIGKIIVQPISVESNDDPINSANITALDMVWIEPANQDITVSEDFLSTSILDDALDAVESASDTVAAIRQTAFSPIQAARSMVDKTTRIINTATNILTQTVADINNEVNQTVRSLDALLDSTILAADEIASSIYQLANLPSLVSNNFQSRFDSYRDMVDQLTALEIPSTDIGEEGFNTVKIQEVAMSMALITVATMVADSEFETRAQVIDAIEKTVAITNDINAVLDTQQGYFDALDIDNQFFSMDQSYNDIMNLMSLALKLLTLTSFDLKTEKRFTLEKERSPFEITVTEYGSLGDNDENLILFNESNKLKAEELYLLPYGKEVVIYVG